MSYIKKRKHSSLCRQPILTSLASGAGLGAAVLAGLTGQAVAQRVPDNTVIVQNESSMEDELAESKSQEDTFRLPTTHVTGSWQGYLKDYMADSKFAIPVSETPKTIQVIDENLLDDQQARSLTEALRNSPGVGAFSMGETGSSSTGDAVYIRGVDASGSIFVDGVRDAGSITRDTFNVEQIEVVKGADGSMFGRTALNGTVNMVTKRAGLANDSVVNIVAGSHDQKRVTLDYSRKVAEDSGLRLNVVGEDSGIPGRDRVKRQLWGFAPALSVGLGGDTRLFADYMYVGQDNQPDGGLATLGLPGYHADPDHPEFADAPRPRSKNYYGTRSDYEKVGQNQFTTRVERDFGAASMFHSTLRWGRTHQDYLISSFTSDWDESWDLDDLSDWRARRVVTSKDQINTIASSQTGIVQELTAGNIRHILSYGVELSHERVHARDREVVPATDNYPINIYHPSFDEEYEGIYTGTGARGRVNTVAGYLFDNIAIGSDWHINTGLRLDRYWMRYRDSGNNDLADIEDERSLFSWQLGAVYRLSPSGNIYVQYATALQPPGNDSLMLDRKAKYPDRPEYDPQKARTFELGSKWKFVDNRFLLSASIFRTDITNQVERDEVSGDFVQSGERQVEGLDLSLIGRLLSGWDVMLGYTRMNTKVVSGAKVAKDGSDNLIYTPKDAVTAWTTYRFANGLKAGVGGRYLARMERDAKGTPATPEYIPGYWVADAMLNYELGKTVELQLNGYNLTDKDYIGAINKKGHRYVPGYERSFMLSARIKF